MCCLTPAIYIEMWKRGTVFYWQTQIVNKKIGLGTERKRASLCGIFFFN